MSTTLYRKYRPQKFGEVIAQNHIKVTLEHEIISGKLAQAYLFAGPRGIGKTTVARLLAKALNCQKRQGAEPCDNCLSCQEIREGRSLDLVEIDAASNRGINEIRELREQAKYTPIKERYKVFIIDEVHMLTSEAFNALLKTLEEPPAHAVFVLATTEVHKIPETIISRCQRFNYKKVPLNDIAGHLQEIARKEGVKVSQRVIDNLARISEGYLRDALSLLGQILALGEKEIDEEEASLVIPRSDWQKVMEFINLFFLSKTKEAVVLINQLVEEGGDLEHFTKTTIETLRKVLLAKVSGDWQELAWEAGDEWLKKLVRQTENISSQELVRIIEIFLETLQDLKQTTIVQLPLEIAVVKVSQVLQPKPVTVQKDDELDGQDESSNQIINKSNNQKGKSKDSQKTPSVSIEIVKQKWLEVIEALKEDNHSLASFLKVGQPIEVEKEKIVVGFQYNFHWERVKETKNLKIVETVLEKIFNMKLSLAGLIDKKYQQESLTNNNETVIRPAKKPALLDDQMAAAVIDTFGGEVVSAES